MNTTRLHFAVIAPAFLAFLAADSPGAVTSYDILKIQYFEQNSALQPSLAGFRVVQRAFVDSEFDFTSGGLDLPLGLGTVPLQIDTLGYSTPVWFADAHFADTLDMESTFPDGENYVFALSNGLDPASEHVLPLPTGGLFPDTIPAFAETTRNLLRARPSAGSDIELTFNSFSDLTDGPNGVSSLFEVRVYTTLGVQLAFESGPQSLGVDSVTVPGGTLLPGIDYFAQISFQTSDQFPDDGGTPLGAARYNITTTQNFLTAVPEPAETAIVTGLLLGAGHLLLRPGRRSTR